MNKEELFECLSRLSQTNNLRDGIDIKKEEANIIVNEIERLQKDLIYYQEYSADLLNKNNTFENIIKEVREYLDTLEKQHAYKFVEVDNHTEMRIDENEYLVWCKYNKLLNMLDKGGKQ